MLLWYNKLRINFLNHMMRSQLGRHGTPASSWSAQPWDGGRIRSAAGGRLLRTVDQCLRLTARSAPGCGGHRHPASLEELPRAVG